MPSTLAQRVRQSREIKGLTQVQLAKRATISQGTVSQIESGLIETPKGQSLFKLAEALEVDPRWLLSGDEVVTLERSTFHEEEIVLKLFRRMTPQDRGVWQALGHALLEHAAALGRRKPGPK